MARIGKNQLIKLQKKYKSDQAIARLYGLSRQAVNQLRKRYGIPPIWEKHTERNIQIKELFQTGISVMRLARKFRMSATHIYRIIKE